jgi:pyruvate formate lyase activating enzyme
MSPINAPPATMLSGAIFFGGMQKLTTLDFPGIVSALVFTQGCNFHCPYCHNAQLISTRGGRQSPPCSATWAAVAAYPLIPATTAEAPISETEILSFLVKRADVLDGVAITGGEPCLQPEMESFLP